MSVIPMDNLDVKSREVPFVENGSIDKFKIAGTKPTATFGWRHFQVLMLFLGISCAYSTRVNLSVAIVAMVSSDSSTENYQTFDWDTSVQSLILSSFFWGYVVTQVPAGQIGQRWGAQKLLAIALFCCGILTILNPLAASIGGWKFLCGCRVAMGLFQGCVFPSIHNLLAKWAPLDERGRFGTFVYAGNQFGTLIALPISGLLSASSAGWPSVFYIFGGLTIVWSVAWFFFGADSPSDHPTISAEERDYIEFSLKSASEHAKEVPPTPWKAIFTSPPMWALFIVHCGQTWGLWMLLTEIPTYLSAILGFAIKENGLISALPYFAMWILSFPIGIIADWISKRGFLTLGASRKLFNTIGHWIPGVALLAFGYIEKDQQILAVSILVITVGFNAGTLCGFQINHMDLSPNFAGTMMGITNGGSNICAILAPLIAGLIVTNTHDITQWRTVFFITSGIYFLGNLWFILFGSGEVQWWNEPGSRRLEPNTRPEVTEKKKEQTSEEKV